ncbi:MAG: ester cyclase [Myxococcales bacterium]|nr:ester cyclase [Myxococcales bacterium]
MPSNKEIARRLIEEVWSEGKLELLDEYCAPDYLGHDPYTGPIDRDGLKRQVELYRAAFPDLRGTVDEVIEQGDTVALRCRMTGTHQGELLGIAPTQKSITCTVSTFMHFQNGKLAEDWTDWDALGFLRELGVVKLPEKFAPQHAARPEARPDV